MRLLCALLLPLVLGSCAPYVAAELASLAATDRTLGDHAISALSGKDCSLVRKEAGLAYCKEDELHPFTPIHCYPSLGDVDCYASRRPFGERYRELGETGEEVRPRP